MSTLELEPRELTPEMIKELVEKASPTDFKYLLKLRLGKRKSGCGYVYRWWSNIETLYGDAEIFKLSEIYFDECTWEEEILVIPKTVPVVIMNEFRSDEPRDTNFTEIFVFTSDGWKSVRVDIPK